MTKISVAMTTFNGGTYVGEQIESIIDQARRPDQLVICDDGSTDKTIETILRYQDTSPFPILLYRNDSRLGYRANFLKVANLCEFDLIALSDQDDVWHPSKLERCVSAFEQCNIVLWHHNFSIVDENLHPIDPQPRQPFQPGLASPIVSDPRVYGVGFSLVFHRSLLDYSKHWNSSVDFFDARNPEPHDQWFFGLASALGKISYCSERLALYRQHTSNVVGWHKKRGIGYISELSDTHKRRLDAEEKSFLQRSALFETISRQNNKSDLKDLALKYRTMSSFSSQRLKNIGGRNGASTLAVIARLAFEGAYQNKVTGGAGFNGLLKDIASIFG